MHHEGPIPQNRRLRVSIGTYHLPEVADEGGVEREVPAVGASAIGPEVPFVSLVDEVGAMKGPWREDRGL